MADKKQTLLFKVMMFLEESKSIDLCDAIEYEGKNWLVPNWLEPATGEWKQPERIVPLERFPHQPSSIGGSSYMVNQPIPKAIWSGPTSPALLKKYGVILQPPIKIETKRHLH